MKRPSGDPGQLNAFKPIINAALAWAAARDRWLRLDEEFGSLDRRAREAHYHALALEEEIINAVEELLDEIGIDSLTALGFPVPDDGPAKGDRTVPPLASENTAAPRLQGTSAVRRKGSTLPPAR